MITLRKTTPGISIDVMDRGRNGPLFFLGGGGGKMGNFFCYFRK